jgi:hypothetical protein
MTSNVQFLFNMEKSKGQYTNYKAEVHVYSNWSFYRWIYYIIVGTLQKQNFCYGVCHHLCTKVRGKKEIYLILHVAVMNVQNQDNYHH